MTSPLVRVTFLLLLLATGAAFLVTQQLKGEFPLVLRFQADPEAISPNDDGYRDETSVGFDLSEKAKVSFSILDSEGNEVRRLVDDRTLEGDTRHRYLWDGRDDSRRVVPDGDYTMRVIRRDEGRVINSIKEIQVDTKTPRVALLSASPSVVSPDRRGVRVRLRYRGPKNDSPEFRIFRTDGARPRVVARFRGDENRGATWYGTLRGRKADDGDYAFTVTVRSPGGNKAVAPAEVPTPASARAGTGVAVRHLTLRGPVTPLRTGARARLEVGPYPRRFRFDLTRLGSRRPVSAGARRGGRFRVRIPRRARTGVYLVRVRSEGRVAVWPVAVRSGSGNRRRPLVVLPTMTWQGENRFDDDLDGFADTLENAPAVALARPFSRGRQPAGLRRQSAPLLRLLDRERLPYDLTTDYALARRQGPALDRAPGVVFAGSARWITPELERRLLRYVERGGRVATFGSGSFRRRVRFRRGQLVRTPGEAPTSLRVIRAGSTPTADVVNRIWRQLR